MLISDLTSEQLLLMLLPAIPNLWGLRHAMYHEFDDPREKTRWMLACVFLPCIGGLAYIAAGRRHARKGIRPASGGSAVPAVPEAKIQREEDPLPKAAEAGAESCLLAHKKPGEWSFGCPDDRKKEQDERI